MRWAKQSRMRERHPGQVGELDRGSQRLGRG
jgi:hypothetical protein